jgi:hypothetical protein
MGNGQYVHDISDLSGPAGGSFSGTRHWFDVFLDVDKRHIYSEKRGYRNQFRRTQAMALHLPQPRAAIASRISLRTLPGRFED